MPGNRSTLKELSLQYQETGSTSVAVLPEEFLEQLYKICRIEATKFFYDDHDAEDGASDAFLCLMERVMTTYDPEKGDPYGYIAPFIKKMFIDYLRHWYGQVKKDGSYRQRPGPVSLCRDERGNTFVPNKPPQYPTESELDALENQRLIAKKRIFSAPLDRIRVLEGNIVYDAGFEEDQEKKIHRLSQFQRAWGYEGEIIDELCGELKNNGDDYGAWVAEESWKKGRTQTELAQERGVSVSAIGRKKSKLKEQLRNKLYERGFTE